MQLRVVEIYYTRISVFFFLILLSLPFSFDYLSFVVLLSAIFMLVFYPLFLRPWELVLSNKRLVLRHQYWNIARFSTQISFNLSHLDSQRITPRIKLIPITLGFGVISGFAIPLIEFSMTSALPTPLLLSILLIFARNISLIGDLNNTREEILFFAFNPFLELSIFFGFVSLIIGIIFIIFGLPRKTKMILSTTGGHKLTLDAGIDETLTDLLFAVSRKHRIKDAKLKNDWSLPLLDDEYVKTQGHVGFIERKTQILGLLGLVIFFDSLDSVVFLILHPSVQNVLLFIIKMFNLLFIWFSISLSKKHRRIIATNHRLLYQEERREISGLWGKRIYQYNDLPYKYIQGFTYSKFSGIRVSSLFGVFIIMLLTSAIIDTYQSSFMIGFTTFLIFGYILFNYKTFTTLSFSSIGGDKIELFYQLPVFLAYVSHRIEEKDWLYDKIFPNILSEQDVADICNTIREVRDPKEGLVDSHEIKVNVFIDKSDQNFGEWNKLRPFRFARESAFLGSFFSLAIVAYATTWIADIFQLIFIVFALVVIVFVLLTNIVFKHRTLMILKNRLFFIEQILPRKVAQLFGVLPERSINEVELKHVLVSNFQFMFGTTLNRLARVFLGITLLGYLIFKEQEFFIFLEPVYRDLLIMVLTLMLIGLITPFIRLIFENIPRYGLKIYTRFGHIQMPYMKDLDRFQHSLKRAKSA